jgi:hypothetical protein
MALVIYLYDDILLSTAIGRHRTVVIKEVLAVSLFLAYSTMLART